MLSSLPEQLVVFGAIKVDTQSAIIAVSSLIEMFKQEQTLFNLLMEALHSMLLSPNRSVLDPDLLRRLSTETEFRTEQITGIEGTYGLFLNTDHFTTITAIKLGYQKKIISTPNMAEDVKFLRYLIYLNAIDTPEAESILKILNDIRTHNKPNL